MKNAPICGEEVIVQNSASNSTGTPGVPGATIGASINRKCGEPEWRGLNFGDVMTTAAVPPSPDSQTMAIGKW